MTRITNTKAAKSVAFGSTQAESLEEYYEAWQWLKDNDIELQEADAHLLEKMKEDGKIL